MKVWLKAQVFLDGVVEYKFMRGLSGLVPYIFEPFFSCHCDEGGVRQGVSPTSFAICQRFGIKSMIQPLNRFVPFQPDVLLLHKSMSDSLLRVCFIKLGKPVVKVYEQFELRLGFSQSLPTSVCMLSSFLPKCSFQE